MNLFDKNDDDKFILLTFIATLLVGFVIRLYQLTQTQDFWHDVAFTYLYSKESLLFIVQGNDVHPPLYYLFIKLIMFVSENEAWLRGVNLLFYFVFMIGVYKVSNKIYLSSFSKVFIYTIFAVSPTMVFYSIEPRNYMFGMMFVIWQFYYFLDLIMDSDDFGTFFWFIILSVFIVYTHFFAGLLFVSEILVALFISRASTIKTFLSFIIVALSSTPLLYYIYLMIPKLHSFWFKDIDFVSFVSSFAYQFFNPEHLSSSSVQILVIVAVFLMLLWSSYIAWFEDKAMFSFLVVFLVPVCLLWGISQFSPMYHHRYFIFFAFGLFFFIAYGLDRLPKKVRWMGLILSVVVFLPFNYHFPDEIALAQESLKSEIAKYGCDEPINIIHLTTFSQSPFKYYFRDYTYVNNLLFNSLTEVQLFTAGGSVVQQWERVDNETLSSLPNKYFVVDDKNYKGGNHTLIHDKGGIKIYYEVLG